MAKKNNVAGDASAGTEGRDWSKTLFLPQTDFPMKAGLPQREPELLARWHETDLYHQLRQDARKRAKYVLHDGPPYANGHLHIGHALNKILKDIITRSRQMTGFDADYVPGWDCHGLPIEWKIEEQYRDKKRNKDEVAVNEFRRECRAFASHWIDVQREEFKRLGVVGDWDNPYTTMAFDAEAVIAGELMKFAMNGTLYQGSKPVMWSVVERTALAEAEVEYEEKESPTIFVRFPIVKGPKVLKDADVVIWTTTPWTIPGNRAIAYSPSISYGLYEVTSAAEDNWTRAGERLVIADDLAGDVHKGGRINEWQRVADVDPASIVTCQHPFHGDGYDFDVKLYAADFVTADTGTGFVHIAPGHGADDYDLYVANKAGFAAAGIPEVPHTVQEDGFYFPDVGIFGGDRDVRVIDDHGKWGKANERVIEELVKRGKLVARGRIKHDYPHSWRSKKPVIFRNTPQWFIAIDKPIATTAPAKGKGKAKAAAKSGPASVKSKPAARAASKAASGKAAKKVAKKPPRSAALPIEGASAVRTGSADTIRARALKAIGETKFTPERGRNRLTGMIENRPDWVISRQRAWGVPITVFVNRATSDYIPNAGFAKSAELVQRITDSFRQHGADAWFEEGAKERYLSGIVDDVADWDQVRDILDVWFDSGSTHAFCLEEGTARGQWHLKWPADLYLEGSDQHRGWFHSSLLESCGTRGRAPYDGLLTHGFVMAEDGRKMSKSLGNVVTPQDVIRDNGAEILRLWVASSDYGEDLRLGKEILKTNVDAYRKLRNTIRFLLGNLAHYKEPERVAFADMPELERYMLNRLHELDQEVRAGYTAFDFKQVFAQLSNFCVVDLSSFYLDIRKDTLYCEPISSVARRAALTVMEELFNCLTAWLAPIMCFTMEEAWLSRHPGDRGSVHLRQFPGVPAEWSDKELAAKWRLVRKVRRVVTGALEIERRDKRIGSSLEAAPTVYIENDTDRDLYDAFDGLDAAEIFITSQAELKLGKAAGEVFRLDDVAGVAVVPRLAVGRKCARSWRISPEVGSDPEFPDLSPRDAEAVRQLDAQQA
jgi:isoleucyl-tRNA synthetase